MMKEYLTNNLFDKKGFAELLNSKGFKAYPTENGVAFDTAILSVPSYKLPIWIDMNIKFMKSEFHTRDIED